MDGLQLEIDKYNARFKWLIEDKDGVPDCKVGGKRILANGKIVSLNNEKDLYTITCDKSGEESTLAFSFLDG